MLASTGSKGFGPSPSRLGPFRWLLAIGGRRVIIGIQTAFVFSTIALTRNRKSQLFQPETGLKSSSVRQC